MMSAKRVAIVCAHWPIHGTVNYIAGQLLECGYVVEIFRHNAENSLAYKLKSRPNLVEIASTDCEPFTPYNLGKQEIPTFGIIRRLRRKVRRLIDEVKLYYRPTSTLFSPEVRNKLLNFTSNKTFNFILAVEKGGLALAFTLGLEARGPILYYSLELYTRNHPLLKANAQMRALWRLEKKYSPIISLFVIQDESRMAVLREDLQIDTYKPTHLFPVSETAETVEKTNLLKNRLNLPENSKIILYFGVVRPERSVMEIARYADRLPRDWILVFHGPCSDSVRIKLESASMQGRVKVSTDMVPANERASLVASADIGLAIYSETSRNDILTGNSSEKVALYLKCGLPIIAKKYQSYEHIEEFTAGVLVDKVQDVPDAVRSIQDRYSVFSNCARRLFDEHYSIEKNVPDLIESIERILG